MHDCKPDPNIPVMCLHVASMGAITVKNLPDDLYVCKECYKRMNQRDPKVQDMLSCICRECIKEHVIIR